MIDLIILAMIKQESQSAYDLQKKVEKRNVCYWIKMSIPSIYKKVLKLTEKGYLKTQTIKEGNMPSKTIYEITKEGNDYLIKNIRKVSEEAVRFFIDYNAVIMSMNCVGVDLQKELINNMKKNIYEFNEEMKEKANYKVQVPFWGEAIIMQQRMLANTMKEWIDVLEKNNNGEIK